jgi:hypothetical protein
MLTLLSILVINLLYNFHIVIVELFLIPLLFLLFAGWGCWAKQLLSIENKSIAVSIITGLALYSLVACIIAFFVPLNTPIEVFLLCFGIMPYVFKNFRKYLPPVPKTILKSAWFWSFALAVILAGSYYNFRSDHFGYYVPTLKWLNESGIIIGMGNIDWTLGQVSFMHIMQAGIDQTIDPYSRFCIFINLIYLIYIFERKSFLLLLFVPFYFLYFQSPSPDLPVVFFSLIVVNEFCFHYKKNDFKILFIISVFVFIIKPTGFWLPLWIFIVTFYRDKNELKSIRNYIFPCFLIFIFLIKNVIASSCLFYPVTSTQINTYWLPDTQILDLSDQQAAAYTYDYQYSVAAINSFSFFDKIYHWLTFPDLQIIIHITIISVALIFGIVSLLKRQFIYISFFFVAIVKLLITLSFSGQFRFMLDIIYPMILFTLLFLPNIKRLLLLSGSLILFISALLFVSFPNFHKKIFPSFRLTKMMVGFTEKALIRPENYACDNYKQEKIGNLNFNIPINDLYNYETPPPAFTEEVITRYYKMEIFPQRKDTTCIRKGFYMKKLSNKEKEVLGRMIENLQ